MSQAIVLDKGEITKVESVVKKQVALTENISIRSQKDLENAKELLTGIMTAKKQVKEKKDGILKPLNEAVKQVRSLFAPIETMIENAETLIKRKMLAYNTKVKEEADKKAAEVQQKVEAGEMTMAKAGASIEKAQAKSEAIPTRKVKKLVVEDESLIPDEYWQLDMVKLRAAVIGGVKVPGAKVVEEDTVVGRGF